MLNGTKANIHSNCCATGKVVVGTDGESIKHTNSNSKSHKFVAASGVEEMF